MNLDLLDKNDHQGAKGPVFIGDQLLVYKRDNNTDYGPGFIDFAGGGKDDEETVLETFAREIKEEFGLEIKKADIKYVKDYASTRFAGETVYFVVAKLPAGTERDIKFGSEGVGYKLVSVSDFLNESKTFDYLKERLEDYLKSSAA